MPEIIAWPSTLVIVGILAYFLGAIPFGIVWARVFGLGDLRQIGSGNIGATNVLRTGNKIAAFLTLVCDAGKGGAAVLLARGVIGEDGAQIAGLCAFLGHCYPVYLQFKGGKGVATFLGTLLALSFPLGVAACLTWLAVAGAMRISSLAALVAAVSAPIWAIWLSPTAIVLCASLAGLILYRHRENIQRLARGEEPRIGAK
jgi:glycerol-3-phosphate acyltransferase PlsY